MALPATDNFNRANESPLGSNWTQSIGGALRIVSQQVENVSAGADCSMYWSADTPGDAQYAQAKVVGYDPSNENRRGPIIRGSATDWVLLIAQDNPDHNIAIQWYNGGAYTVLGSYGVPVSAGDIARLEANGSDYEAFINTVSRITASNASAPSSGYGGMFIDGWPGIARQLDDFEVGNLTGGNDALTAAGTVAQSPACGSAVVNEPAFSRPSADTYAGAWTTDTGSPTGLAATVDEATPNDSDYIQSDQAPSASPVALALSSAVDPTRSDFHIVKYRYQKELAGGQVDLTVELREGYVNESTQGTLIATWSHTDISSGLAQAEQTLSGAQADAITDYADLFIRLEATQI